MKKIFLVVISAVLCCMILVGCKSSAVRNVEALISAIGEVTGDSEEAILKAEDAFNALSIEDQNKVENHYTLSKARADFDAIPAELTPENILKYVEIELSYDDEVDSHSVYAPEVYGVGGFYMGKASYCGAAFSIYPRHPGVFSNVTLQIEIDNPSQWEARNSKYSEKEGVTSINVDLPRSGEYSERFDLRYTGDGLFGTSSAPSPCSLDDIHIVSVSGTYTKNP